MGFLDNAGLTTLWNKIVGKSIPYGYCQTAKGTVAKTVTVSPAITELTTGLTIAVRFQYENTSTNPTLKVNTTDAKAIKRYGTTSAGTSATASWQAGEVRILTYNGSYWMLCDWNNTSYSGMTSAEVTAGTGTSNRVITPARLKEAIQYWATGEANVQSNWNETDSTSDAYILNKPTIPSKTSDLTNDSGFITSYTETDPVFTASPAHGITANDITNWNGKSDFSGSYTDLTNQPTIPTRLDLTENWTAPSATLVVNGSTASLNLGNTTASPYTLMTAFNSIAGVRVIQIVGGSAQAPQARVYEIAEGDLTNCTMRLVSVDDGVIYTADLSASDLFGDLTGTFSSQAIPTGGITTETDPTVPSWAKASTKPSYEADEISFSVPQAYEVGNATDVEGAILDLDEAVTNAKSTASSAHTLASNALPKSGGQLTGDLTLYVASGNSPAIIFQRGTLTDNYNDWKIYDKSGFLYFAQRGSGSSAFGDMGYIDTSGVLHFNIPWGNVTGKPTIPSKTSDLTNDSGFITGVQAPDVVFATQGSHYLDLTSEVDGALNALDSAIGTIAGDCDEIAYGQTTVAGALNDLYTKTLPTVTASDNGKVLRVVNGAWSAVALPSASGVSF